MYSIYLYVVLQRYKDESSFDPKCRQVVVHRMIEQSHDYRFNPLLQEGCRIDISKFCSEVIATEPQDKELEGKVVKCLKVQRLSLYIIQSIKLLTFSQMSLQRRGKN